MAINEAARTLFTEYQRQIAWQARTLGEEIRAVLGQDSIARMSTEQHKELKAELEHALHRAVTTFLQPFNNVGCTLAGPIIGFRITSCPSPGSNLASQDIGDGYTDYTALWNEFSPAPRVKRLRPLHDKIDAAMAKHQPGTHEPDDSSAS